MIVLPSDLFRSPEITACLEKIGKIVALACICFFGAEAQIFWIAADGRLNAALFCGKTTIRG